MLEALFVSAIMIIVHLMILAKLLYKRWLNPVWFFAYPCNINPLLATFIESAIAGTHTYDSFFSWCATELNGKYKFITSRSKYNDVLLFAKKDDLILFKLTWL
jgi:hypothetical protein